MKIALEEYVPEELINTLANMKGCERNPYAFQFLVALAEYPESETMINLKAALKKEGDSTLNVKQIPNVLQYINAVVAQNKLNKSVEIINEYIARNTCESIEKILEAAVAKLSRGDDAKDECSRLQEL